MYVCVSVYMYTKDEKQPILLSNPHKTNGMQDGNNSLGAVRRYYRA